MLYINNSENRPNKSLYYNLENKVYNLELIIKYIEKKLEFKKFFKKVLEIIKFIIFKKNINRFKNKKDIIFL